VAGLLAIPGWRNVRNVRLSNISAPFWQSAVSYRRASGPRPQRVVKPAVIATWAGLRILHITACSWCRAGITFTWRRGRKIVAMGSNMDAKIPPSPAANEFVFSRSILPPKSTAADFFSRQEHAAHFSRTLPTPRAGAPGVPQLPTQRSTVRKFTRSRPSTFSHSLPSTHLPSLRLAATASTVSPVNSRPPVSMGWRRP
jgi:hypothetical protein